MDVMEIRERRSPDELVRRLGAFRYKHDQGAISTERFKEILAVFRFTDDQGRVWSPGANTRSWYVWEGGGWRRSSPPPVLSLPTESERIKIQKSERKEARYCRRCGQKQNPGARFCVACGTPVV